jgi:hypothetical protein
LIVHRASDGEVVQALPGVILRAKQCVHFVIEKAPDLRGVERIKTVNVGHNKCANSRPNRDHVPAQPYWARASRCEIIVPPAKVDPAVAVAEGKVSVRPIYGQSLAPSEWPNFALERTFVALAILANCSDHRFTGARMTILAAQIMLLAI